VIKEKTSYAYRTSHRSMATALPSYNTTHIPVPDKPLLDDDYDLVASGFNAVERDPESWAGALPANQGLYMNEQDRDACGVGFICHVKGDPSHKIVSDARQLLCAMTHRGATGADASDGDGAGVMTSIPHRFFKREAERDLECDLPEPGQYAVGNVFLNPNDPQQADSHRQKFENIASDLGLRVLGWREVPTDGTILGPAAGSKEPKIMQPFVVLQSHYGSGNKSENNAFDEKHFERQLYVLRKHATHSMLVNVSLSFAYPCLPSLYMYDPFSYRSVVSPYQQYSREMVLRVFPVNEEYRLQGTVHTASSVQLLP
jgi:hypothetical protein